MLRERVTEDVYVFISDLYVEVAATVVVTPEGAVVIDTLPFPQETRQIREFALRKCPRGIRYVVNTHHHADHIYGSYLFPEAELIAHRRCREILLKAGEESLAQAKAQTPALAPVELRIPQLVFETDLLLRLGEKTLHLLHAPGHTVDGIVVHISEDNLALPPPLVLQVDVSRDREKISLECLCADLFFVDPRADECLGGDVFRLQAVTREPESKPIDIIRMGLIDILEVDHRFP